MRKYLRLGVIIPVLIGWYVYSQPLAAAAMFNRGLDKLEHAGNSAAAFISNIG